jgi:hypothetical protein
MTRPQAGARLAAVALAAALPALAGTAARAAPPADPTSIWTIQDENSSISSASLTDRYYVNGLRIGWTSPTDSLPSFLSDFDRLIWGDGRQRISLGVGQQIFTPRDTTSVPPPRNDRPYAGYLAITGTMLSDTDHARSLLAVSLGLVGPESGAEDLQNGFHDVIGQKHALGWKYQLQDEPTIEILAERTWRYNLARFGSPVGGLEVDALPEITGAVGNVRVYAQTGFSIRLGQGLDSDYGVPRFAPGLNGADAYTQTRPFAWYVFAGADGQLVGKDITLNGNSFRDSYSVVPKPFVGEMQVGLAILFSGVRLTYTQVFQTEEFQHQKGGLHQFGSFALSAHF